MAASEHHELPSHPETGIWVWDHDRRKIVWANDSAVRVWGEDSLLDLIDRDFAPGDQLTMQFAHLLHTTLATNADQVRAVLMLAPEGKPRRFEGYASRFRLSDGRTGLRVEVYPMPTGEDGRLDRMVEVFNTAPQAMSLFAEDGSLMIQNAAADFIFGAGKLSGLAQRYGERKPARDALRALLVTGSFSQSVVLQTRVGPRRHRVTLRRMLDPVTGEFAALAAFSDTAERDSAILRAVAGERDAETAVLSLLDAGVAVYDDALKPLYVSERARALLGTSGPENTSQLGRLFPRDRKRLSDALIDIRDGHVQERSIDLTVRPDDSAARWIELTIRKGRWRGADAWVATVLDVTETRRATIAAQRAVDDRESALDVVGVGVATLREDGSIVHLSKAGETLLGKSALEIKNTSFASLLSDASQKVFEGVLEETKANDAFSITLKADNGSDGKRLTMGFSNTDRYNRGFRVLTFTALATPQRHTPTVFDSREAVARTSHELRTPLNAIMGFTQLMLDDTSSIKNPAYVQYLSDIHESGIYMLRLMQDMLDIRRIETGALSLEPGPIDLGNLVRIVVREIDFAARKRNVDITISIEPNLPAVVADMHTIRQALTNIVSNAVKFTAPSGWVRISAVRRASGAVELEVIDNGEGMEAEEIKVAMTPFAQMPGNHKSYGGAGMGLPLAKGFIEANEARFELSSEKNLGTIARIVFPPMQTAPHS